MTPPASASSPRPASRSSLPELLGGGLEAHLFGPVLERLEDLGEGLVRGNRVQVPVVPERPYRRRVPARRLDAVPADLGHFQHPFALARLIKADDGPIDQPEAGVAADQVHLERW